MGATPPSTRQVQGSRACRRVRGSVVRGRQVRKEAALPSLGQGERPV